MDENRPVIVPAFRNEVTENEATANSPVMTNCVFIRKDDNKNNVEFERSAGGLDFWTTWTMFVAQKYNGDRDSFKKIHEGNCVIITENREGNTTGRDVEKALDHFLSVENSKNVAWWGGFGLLATLSIVSFIASGFTGLIGYIILAVIMLVSARKQSSTRKKPDTGKKKFFPAEITEFTVVSFNVKKMIQRIIELTGEEPRITNLLMKKIRIERDHAKLEEWLVMAVKLFEADNSFPEDSVPLMNDDLRAVVEVLVAHQVKQGVTIDNEDDRMVYEIAKSDSEIARGNALIHIETYL